MIELRPDQQTTKDISIEYGMNSGKLTVPEDAYECVITEIRQGVNVNKLSRTQQMGGWFEFQIIDGIYKGQTFTQFFTNKLTKRSKLTVLSRAIWGREFEPAEMAQIKTVNDLQRFLLNKPLKVVLLLRHSFLTDSIWYDVAFFLKSEFFDETINQVIIPVEEVSSE